MSGTRVLVLEDERRIADLYSQCLRDTGYEVETVHTVEDAVETADERFDVALLDRRLPDGDGSVVLSTLREQGLDIRVAMVTAVEPDFDIVEMGFDLYLLKPVPQSALIGAVETLASRSEYDEKLRETASLVSKRAVLEAEKPPRELDESERYEELIARIDRLDEELTDLTEEFSTEDYRTMFRDIGQV